MKTFDIPQFNHDIRVKWGLIEIEIKEVERKTVVTKPKFGEKYIT